MYFYTYCVYPLHLFVRPSVRYNSFYKKYLLNENSSKPFMLAYCHLQIDTVHLDHFEGVIAFFFIKKFAPQNPLNLKWDNRVSFSSDKGWQFGDIYFCFKLAFNLLGIHFFSLLVKPAFSWQNKPMTTIPLQLWRALFLFFVFICLFVNFMLLSHVWHLCYLLQRANFYLMYQ